MVNKATEPNGALYASPPPESIITPPSSNKYAVDRYAVDANVEAESDVGVEEIGEEEIDDELEEQLDPMLEHHISALRQPNLR